MFLVCIRCNDFSTNQVKQKLYASIIFHLKHHKTVTIFFSILASLVTITWYFTPKLSTATFLQFFCLSSYQNHFKSFSSCLL